MLLFLLIKAYYTVFIADGILRSNYFEISPDDASSCAWYLDQEKFPGYEQMHCGADM